MFEQGVALTRQCHTRLSEARQRVAILLKDGARPFDPEAGTVVERIAVGKRPRGIRLSRDGKQLLVALSGSPIAGPGVDESKLPPPDRAADGVFYYSVRTTGVYCRPSCGARPALRANVAFHDSCTEAESAGFRACLRCKPDQPPLS